MIKNKIMDKDDLELIRFGFQSFKFIIEDNTNLTFTNFANMIENHSTSIQAKEIAKTYRKYKGVVSKDELILDRNSKINTK